ncbi:EAL domain-containing protein [Pseudomonadota bacterium]
MAIGANARISCYHFCIGSFVLSSPLYRKKAKENAVVAALETAQEFKLLRAYYTDRVVSKVLAGNSGLTVSHEHKSQPNTIPLPASLIHDMSALINENNKDIHIKFYSPFPFKNRQERTMDAFGKAAWAALKSNSATQYSQHKKIDGRSIIRVAVGDTMIRQICIDCHNSHPLSPKKDWELGELRGVLEVSYDITSLTESGQKTGLFLALGLIVFFGAIFALTFRKTYTEIQYWTRELALSEHEVAARIFDTMNQAVVVTDKANKIVSINSAGTKITGYTIEEIKGKNPRIFASGRQNREFYIAMWESLTTSGHWEGEIWDRRKDGELYLKWMTINVIYNRQGDVNLYVAISSDITERKRKDELIWKQANFDALTGLTNRSLFQKQLQQGLEHCKRSGSMLALIYLDLDGFKDINDSLGHTAGDELLLEVAQRLQERARQTDTLARLGGDEFTLLVTNFQKPEQIGSLAEHILEVLTEPFVIQNREIHIGASIGIAIYPDDGTSPEELIKHADIAMYHAKASGKNQFQFFRYEMNTKAVHRLSMIHDLHKAVADKAFKLHYQPKIRLADHKIIGMEALIRWPQTDGQIISPLEFIPCAEETGLIIPLGNWILAEACRQTEEWNQQFDTQLRVAVNLSARQFRVNDIANKVLHALRAQSLSPHLLELEITESILMDDVEEAIQIMTVLRDYGISIAIDDFGTGYSSLNYLKRFPISTLKIDQSFVRDLTEDSEDAAIVCSIISLAKSLNLEVVAEGVETAEQLSFLSHQHCHSIQGYHIAKPMPPDQFEAFLRSRSKNLI